MKLTPEQLLKYAILELHQIWTDEENPISTNLTGEEIDTLWDEAEDIYDAIHEIRSSGVETGLETPYSRHYEATAVAVMAPNYEWVGFTYWYGGGKHGNPQEIDWIEHAYHVNHKEEQKVMTVHTFTTSDKFNTV